MTMRLSMTLSRLSHSLSAMAISYIKFNIYMDDMNKISKILSIKIIITISIRHNDNMNFFLGLMGKPNTKYT